MREKKEITHNLENSFPTAPKIEFKEIMYSFHVEKIQDVLNFKSIVLTMY